MTQQSEREMLEAAAKAAGLWDHKNDCIDIPWSALTNDGDALRLACGLGIDLLHCHHSGLRTAINPITAERFTDNCARRAITRAAAAMAPSEGREG